MKKTLIILSIILIALPAQAERRSSGPTLAATGQIEAGGYARQELFTGQFNWGTKLRFGRHFHPFLQWGVNLSNQYYDSNFPQDTSLNLTKIPILGDEFALGGDLRFYPFGSKHLLNPYLGADVGLVINSLKPYFGGALGVDWIFARAVNTDNAFVGHGVNLAVSWNNVKNFSFGLNYTLKGFDKN